VFAHESSKFLIPEGFCYGFMVGQKPGIVKGICLINSCRLDKIRLRHGDIPLPNKYLVKALISRPGQSASVRFVPLEIFDLWKSHMCHTHDYQITAVQTSMWVRASDELSEQFRYSGREAVVGVFLKKKVGSVAMPVERYFSQDEVDRILPKFLSHYGISTADSAAMSQVSIVRGFFLAPDEVFSEDV
jgi:hypothetical protein